MAIFGQPLWMSAITKNRENGCYAITIKNIYLRQKLAAMKFGLSLNFNMFPVILDVSSYQKLQKNGCQTPTVKDRHLHQKLIPCTLQF